MWRHTINEDVTQPVGPRSSTKSYWVLIVLIVRIRFWRKHDWGSIMPLILSILCGVGRNFIIKKYDFNHILLWTPKEKSAHVGKRSAFLSQRINILCVVSCNQHHSKLPHFLMTNDNVSLRLVKGDASSVGIRYFILVHKRHQDMDKNEITHIMWTHYKDWTEQLNLQQIKLCTPFNVSPASNRTGLLSPRCAPRTSTKLFVARPNVVVIRCLQSYPP